MWNLYVTFPDVFSKMKTISLGRGWRLQNRQKFEQEVAGKFPVSNFPLHRPLVVPVRAVSRNHMESVSEEGTILYRGLF